MLSDIILIISLLLNQFCYGSVNIKSQGFNPQKLHIKCMFIENNYQSKTPIPGCHKYL